MRLIRFASRELQLDYLSVYASSTPPCFYICERERECVVSAERKVNVAPGTPKTNSVDRGPFLLDYNLCSLIRDQVHWLCSLPGSVAHGAFGVWRVHFTATANTRVPDFVPAKRHTCCGDIVQIFALHSFFCYAIYIGFFISLSASARYFEGSLA